MDDHTPAALNGNGRAVEEGDWIAGQFFTPDDLALSPDEYVARNAHNWGCFSFHEYTYRDPALGAWVKRVGELLFTAGELERCRRQFLTTEELAEVRAREAEAF